MFNIVAQMMFLILLIPLIVMLLALRFFGLIDFRTACQLLSFVPDRLGGIHARRVFYRLTLRSVGRSLVVSWLATVEVSDTVLGDNVYIGPKTSIGLATIGSDVLISASVSIVSGVRQHGTARGGVPMRAQPGQGKVRITIGDDVWIGVGALVGADVASGSVLAMGAVVVRPIQEPFGIHGGNPARLLRERSF